MADDSKHLVLDLYRILESHLPDRILPAIHLTKVFAPSDHRHDGRCAFACVQIQYIRQVGKYVKKLLLKISLTAAF